MLTLTHLSHGHTFVVAIADDYTLTIHRDGELIDHGIWEDGEIADFGPELLDDADASTDVFIDLDFAIATALRAESDEVFCTAAYQISREKIQRPFGPRPAEPVWGWVAGYDPRIENCIPFWFHSRTFADDKHGGRDGSLAAARSFCEAL